MIDDSWKDPEWEDPSWDMSQWRQTFNVRAQQEHDVFKDRFFWWVALACLIAGLLIAGLIARADDSGTPQVERHGQRK